MEKTDVVKIISSISALFPNYKLSELEMKNTINAWHIAFDGFSYMDINNALLMYVRTSGSAYPPSAPQLIAMTQKAAELTELNPQEAWGLVRRALNRSIYYAEQEFSKLPAAVQKSVGSPAQLEAWAQTDEESIETVVSSNFQRTYKATLERQRQINLMPDDVKKLVTSTVQSLEEKKND